MPPKTRKKTTRSTDKIVKAGIFNTELFYPRIVLLTIWNLTSHFLASPFIEHWRIDSPLLALTFKFKFLINLVEIRILTVTSSERWPRPLYSVLVVLDLNRFQCLFWSCTSSRLKIVPMAMVNANANGNIYPNDFLMIAWLVHRALSLSM
jgi:hypothetical protein